MDAHVRTVTEEAVNTVTHGLGFVLSLAGAAAMIGPLRAQADGWRTLGCGIFAFALVAVYWASTLSHAVSSPAGRRAFRTLDQASIYLLIAGTYTPFALAYLRFGWWWTIFFVMWAGALVGFVSKLLFSHRIDAVTIWSYVLLGWIPIAASPYYSPFIPAAALWGVLIGGLCYTAGTIFLVLDHRRFHFHGIWHLFVMAGSACHYWAVYRFVAQAAQAI